MEKIVMNIIFALLMPGIIATLLLGLVKEMGDGRGNESGMAEGFMWVIIFNIVFYGCLLFFTIHYFLS